MFKDWLKRFTDNKGSAMVMVIVAIVFLSVLGLAILSLSVASLKVSLFDKKATMSFYMAESGLEQAYDVILNNVKGAIEAGNVAVARKVEEYVAGGGTENVAEIMENPDHEKYQEWLGAFQEEYREYLQYFLIADLGEEDNYFEVGESGNRPQITIDTENTSVFADDTNCYVTLKSTYNSEEYHGKTIPQEVQMKFSLQVPSAIPGTVQVISTTSGGTGTGDPGGSGTTDPPTYADSDSLFDCVLVSANNNVVVDRAGRDMGGGTIKYSTYRINGNIYAYGNSRKEEDYSTYKDYLNALGGFTLHVPMADVEINGTLATSENLQHKVNGASYLPKNSKIVVNGDVYAQNIAINENRVDSADNQLNNTITIMGDAYTSRDLILNATSKINIEGTWFYTPGISGQVKNPSILNPPTVDIITAGTSECSAEQLDRLAFKQQQFHDMGDIMEDIYFKPPGSYPSGGKWEYTFCQLKGTNPADGQPYVQYLQSEKYTVGGTTHHSVGSPIPTYIGLDDPEQPWTDNREQNHIEELYWVDNTDKQLYIIAPGSTFSPQGDTSFATSKRAVYVKDNFRGVIVNKGQVWFYGVKEFKGLLLTPHCIRLGNNSFDWDNTITSPIPMVLEADKTFVKNKINEIKNPTPIELPGGGTITHPSADHFKYEDTEPDPPAGGDDGDSGDGGSTGGTGTTTTVTGSTLTGNPVSEDFIKNLIEVSDWTKLS
jgi:hypothetical protein